MSETKHINNILLEMASDSKEEWHMLLRNCPVIQSALLAKGKISLNDLSDTECDSLIEHALLEDWIDGQEVMQRLHISPRTLQTLRSNGTIPYTRIGNKLYYLRQDIERVLRNNYIMFKLHERYGKEDK